MAQTVAEYMEEVSRRLYSNPNVLSKKDTFKKAPEMIRIFGEMIGAWAVYAWHRNGRPKPIQLIEMGPGRGTLMRDMLHTIDKIAPELYAILQVVMVENSKNMVRIQKDTLRDIDKEITWLKDIREIKDIPFLAVANLFFNALPIHQFEKTEEGFRERLVQGQNYVLSDEDPAYLTEYFTRDHVFAPAGSIVEICPSAISLVRFLADKMRNMSSSFLILDYGYSEPSKEETLIGVCNHKKTSIFSDENGLDLTAQVDFSALRSIAMSRDAKVYGPVPQGIWLQQLGVKERAAHLIDSARSDYERGQLKTSLDEALSLSGKGKLLKSMTIYSKQ